MTVKSYTVAGMFNGNGHVLSNLDMGDSESGDNRGLFGYIGSTGRIQDVGIQDANLTGAEFLGLMVGRNEGSLLRCYAKGRVIGRSAVGGLIGVNKGTVSHCYAVADVTAFLSIVMQLVPSTLTNMPGTLVDWWARVMKVLQIVTIYRQRTKALMSFKGMVFQTLP